MLGSFDLTTNALGDLNGSPVIALDTAGNAAFFNFLQADTDGLITLMMRRTDTDLEHSAFK